MLHKILVFLLILLTIEVMVALGPFFMEAMFIMYIEGIMPFSICTGTF